MNDKNITPARRISGSITLPGDKSISHRAIIVGSIAKGTTKIKNFLTSMDCLYTLKAFQSMGIKITSSASSVTVNGQGLTSLKAPSKEIYLGNSGTSMRLISGVLAAQRFRSVLTGDSSLSQRPMDRIIKPLKMMGARLNARDGKFPPLTIHGGELTPIQYKSPIASAQVKSAIILAGLYANGLTSVIEPAKSRDHTERMLKYFGAEVSVDDLKVSIKGPAELVSKTLEVPGDISSASFFIALASILDGSEIVLLKVLHNSTRLGFIEKLLKMGAIIDMKNIRQNGYEEICDIVVRTGTLKAIEIGPQEVPGMIDELPIFMVVACFANGRTRIRGASELRVKETDRINSMVTNLKKMGAAISVEGEDITIVGPRKLESAELSSYGDHRTAMSMSIAALLARGNSVVKDIECIDTSFPGFFKSLDKLLKK